MDVFKLRNSLINDYSSYVLSFLQIQDQRIRDYVLSEMKDGLFWPDPLIQLNPAYEQGKFVDQLVEEGILHDECRNIFSIKSSQELRVKPLRLYKHQEDAIRIARTGSSYVLTTGTGSGKSLAYIIPIEGGKHFLWQGLEKFTGNFKFTFCQPYGAFILSVRTNRPDFSNRDIPFA